MSGLLRAAEEVEKLDQDLDTKAGVVDTIRALLVKFPDLMVYRPQHNNKYELVCCSSAVNGYVDAFEYTEAVDGDGPPTSYVWPHTTVDNMKVYSNPPYFTVGAVNTKGFGVVPEIDWEEKLASDNMPLSLIRKVRAYLRGKPPINYVE